MLAFAFGLALLTGIIFGAAPAWLATRTDPAEALHGPVANTDRSSFARKALLIIQATVSVVLVAGATMLGRSLNKLEHQDFGYKVQGRVEVDLNSLPANLRTRTTGGIASPTRRRIEANAGKQGAGLALYNPLTVAGASWSW